MENPVNAQPAEDFPQQTDKRKYRIWSILVGLLYGIPALLIGFLASFILIILVFFLLLPFIFPSFDPSSFASGRTVLDVIIGISVFVALVLALVAGIVSGRAAYKNVAAEGGFRQTGYSLASCSCAGLLGILTFPFLCDAGFYGIASLLSALHLDYLLSGIGTESGVTIIFIFCLPSVGIILAYPAALLVGVVTSRLLKRKPKASA